MHLTAIPSFTIRKLHGAFGALENIVYMGTSGLNKFVPKVGDHVWNLTTNEKFRVAELINYIPRFEPIETADSEGSASLSAGVGANPEYVPCSPRYNRCSSRHACGWPSDSGWR